MSPQNLENDSSRRVRPEFVAALSRVSLTLGFAHFLSVALIFVFRGDSSDQAFAQYATLVTATGMMLMLVSFLCRYPKLFSKLPYLCFGVLFAQAAVLLFREKTLFHPFAMLFPLLVSLGAPILGQNRSYALGALSNLVLFSYALIFSASDGVRLRSQIPSLFLLLAIVVVSAYIAETLWHELAVKEERLRAALGDVSKKAEEMEAWVHRLGQASSLISEGYYSAELPEPLPQRVFMELTKSLEQMQDRLRQYFGDLLLKDRLSSLGVLATGIAHELNTPLTTIQFILDSDDRIPEELRMKIEAQCQHLGSIAKGLLSFARPTEEENFDLNAVVTASESLMKYMKQGISIDVKLHGEPLPVRGFANQVQQVLMNLFNNAVDALEGRSSPAIYVETRRRTSSLVELIFRDNGCGMDRETLGRVIDPFFTTKVGKGTGLGLFVVHQIVQGHGAALEIQSEPGKGTEIRIVLPSKTATGMNTNLSKAA